MRENVVTSLIVACSGVQSTQIRQFNPFRYQTHKYITRNRQNRGHAWFIKLWEWFGKSNLLYFASLRHSFHKHIMNGFFNLGKWVVIAFFNKWLTLEEMCRFETSLSDKKLRSLFVASFEWEKMFDKGPQYQMPTNHSVIYWLHLKSINLSEMTLTNCFLKYHKKITGTSVFSNCLLINIWHRTYSHKSMVACESMFSRLSCIEITKFNSKSRIKI
jgi:hypothetical protein